MFKQDNSRLLVASSVQAFFLVSLFFDILSLRPAWSKSGKRLAWHVASIDTLLKKGMKIAQLELILTHFL